MEAAYPLGSARIINGGCSRRYDDGDDDDPRLLGDWNDLSDSRPADDYCFLSKGDEIHKRTKKLHLLLRSFCS